MTLLHDWHEKAQGEFQDFSGTPIVSTYGRLPMEYAAIYRSAAVIDMPQRGVLAVSGEERHAFLNSLLTAEVVNRESGKSLSAGETRFSFLLERKGRILAEMNLFETGDRCLLEMDRRLLAEVAKELEKYHFREKVLIAIDESSSVLCVLGPAAAKVLSDTLSVDAASLVDGAGLSTPAMSLWRMDMGQAVHFTLVVPSSEVLSIWERLLADDKAALPAGWAAYNAARVEAARGAFGIDYDATFLPAETGQLDRAVSFTKGCYPGQEIVARMQSRDQYTKRLVQLKFADDAMPLAGAKVLDAAGDEIGVITSSTISPRHSGVALALAILKREAIDARAPVSVAAEGAIRSAMLA